MRCFSAKQAFTLFSPALPLFFSAFGLMMIASMPKYAIDYLMPGTAQAVYGILYLPAQVVSLLSNFVFKPIIGAMAYEWKEHTYTKFILRIRRLLIIIVFSDLAIIVPAWFLGTPILGFLSGIDLSAYRLELIVLIVGGAFTAATALLLQAITIMRHQTVAFGIYLIITALSVALDLLLVHKIGLLGASLGYFIQVALLAGALYGAYRYFLKRNTMTMKRCGMGL